MILPLNYYLFTSGIKQVLREKDAEYLFSRQEPKFIVDVFETGDSLIEVYIHKTGYCQLFCQQTVRKTG